MNNENKFIVGIDFGNFSSTVSYFDFNKMDIEVLDASGGYGKFSVPTVVSYNPDTEDWIFGEYAILNKGFANDFIVEDIIDNLGKNISYNINGKEFGLNLIFSKFIEFLIENIKNINPNAYVEGVVVSISSSLSENALSDIKESFKLAGMEKRLLKVSNYKDCILKSYFYENDILGNNILSIDYSSREIRASIYKVENNGNIKCLKTYTKNDLGQQKIFNITKKLITKKFLEETGKLDLTEYEKNNIDVFCYQQFDIIFQRQNLSSIKLYYNFFYPPFQKVISKEEIFYIISHFENKLNSFFNELFKDLSISEYDIKDIILTGGGMEIDFIHKYIKSRFNTPVNVKGKAKRVISDGACLIACEKLGVLPKTDIHIEDINQILYNIGVILQDKKCKFEPLIYKNSFIWQDFDKKIVCITRKDDVDFSLYIDKGKDDIKLLQNIKLNLNDYVEFQSRDIKTIRFIIHIKFNGPKEMIFSIEDFGFGEIYKKTDFKKRYLIKL